jgi:hypothetical protein
MREPDEKTDPALLPNGTMAIVQHQDLLRLGIKGDDGVWRDKNGQVLETEKMCTVLSLRLPK